MNDALANRVWESTEFREQFSNLNRAWLQRELKMDATIAISDLDIVRCVQAAAILALSNDPARQRAAYSIAACANDLRGSDLPGLAGALRVVLTRMGNFPAVGTAEAVRSFHRLPTRVAKLEDCSHSKLSEGPNYPRPSIQWLTTPGDVGIPLLIDWNKY